MDIDGLGMTAENIMGDIADPEFEANGIVLRSQRTGHDIGRPEVIVILADDTRPTAFL